MSDQPGIAGADDAGQKTGKGFPIGKVVIGLAALVTLVLLARQAGEYIPLFAEWVEDQGIWGPVAFIAVYAAATVAFVPGSLLTLAGGAVFGLWKGSLYVFAAAVLGSCGAFLTSRYAARSAIEARFGRNARFAAIDRAVEREGLKIVFLLRLSPLFPFNALNYALGLTGIRFRDYVVASLGMIPGTILYVYYGWIAGDVAALAGGAAPERTPIDYGVQALGLVATVVVTAIVTRLARRALKQATDTATATEEEAHDVP
ncbi:MAG: TVP38/TMEM64 family protein [Proteobacteria bacterium]|nr:TVP38/TMEM64 family protein [Pseudomonadota bacterium]